MNSRVKVLDYGRGIAASFVLIYHATITINIGKWPSDPIIREISEFILFPSKFGEASVYFFMALSGFVLSRVVQKSVNIRVRDWLIWRAIRLVPIYLISLLVAFLLISPNFTEFRNLKIYLTPYFLFSDDTIYSGPNPVLWSLMIEIMLSSVFLVIFSMRIHEWKYLNFIYISTYSLTYLIPTWGGRAFVRCLIFFLIGISLAKIQKNRKYSKNLLLIYIAIWILVSGIWPTWGRQFITLTQIVIIPQLIHYLANVDNQRCNASFILNHLGKISFTLYAFHWPMLIYIKNNLLMTESPFLNSKVILIPLVCTLCVGTCSLIYLLIEKPIITLSRGYLKYALKNSAIPVNNPD